MNIGQATENTSNVTLFASSQVVFGICFVSLSCWGTNSLTKFNFNSRDKKIFRKKRIKYSRTLADFQSWNQVMSPANEICTFFSEHNADSYVLKYFCSFVRPNNFIHSDQSNVFQIFLRMINEPFLYIFFQ